MGGPPIMEMSGVTFGYHGKGPLLNGVDIAIKEGGYYFVEGPSGSGKSTLLRLMNRLEEPASGEVRFRGAPLSSYDATELRRGVSMIQQTPTVIDASVRHNLLLPFGFKVNRGLKRPGDVSMRGFMDRFLLDGVGLDDNALELSVGQRQRLCFIRALLLKPAVMLLDEPTASLDEHSASIVENAAVELNRDRGLTVVNVSHRGVGIEPSGALFIKVDGGVVTVSVRD